MSGTTHLPAVAAAVAAPAATTTTATVAVGAAAEAATATTATTVTATTAATTTVRAHLLELAGDFGLGLTENANKLASLLGVIGGKVGVRSTLGAGTTGTANAVDVVFAVVGEVVVDDVARMSAKVYRIMLT